MGTLTQDVQRFSEVCLPRGHVLTSLLLLSSPGKGQCGLVRDGDYHRACKHAVSGRIRAVLPLELIMIELVAEEFYFAWEREKPPS